LSLTPVPTEMHRLLGGAGRWNPTVYQLLKLSLEATVPTHIISQVVCGGQCTADRIASGPTLTGHLWG